MRQLLGGFLSLLAPLRCLGCDEASNAPAFCETCATLAERASDPCAVFEYGGPVADAIQRFKYDGRSELGARLGALMAVEARAFAADVDAVVPVPLHWRRRRTRGYDQAALLAKPIAKSLGVQLRIEGLRRVRNTVKQVDLPYRERQQNIAGAFSARHLGEVRRVLLIDDVRTTGATLSAASDALHAVGVSKVVTLVLATRLLRQGT